MSTSGLLILGASMVLGACAAPQRRMADDNQRLAVEVAEMRAQARRDRRLIRDLENRLVLSGAGAVVTSDPVVVQDAPTASTPMARELPPDNEPMTMVGSDETVEVIYEGEAALESTRRPRLTLHERSTFGGDPDADDSMMVTSVAGELPVTRGEVPTVDAQLRRARSSPIRQRASATAVDPREEYQRYYAALEAGNHAYAMTGFRHFVERFPEHDFADNAQYWLGESYYDQKDFKSAATAFRQVVDRYPRGNKVADALLKLGFCHAALGRTDDARKVLRQVAELYPRTSSARLAAERLIVLERTP